MNNMIALVMGTQSDHIQFANSDSNVSVYGVSGERVILYCGTGGKGQSAQSCDVIFGSDSRTVAKVR